MTVFRHAETARGSSRPSIRRKTHRAYLCSFLAILVAALLISCSTSDEELFLDVSVSLTGENAPFVVDVAGGGVLPDSGVRDVPVWVFLTSSRRLLLDGDDWSFSSDGEGNSTLAPPCPPPPRITATPARCGEQAEPLILEMGSLRKIVLGLEIEDVRPGEPEVFELPVRWAVISDAVDPTETSERSYDGSGTIKIRVASRRFVITELDRRTSIGLR